MLKVGRSEKNIIGRVLNSLTAQTAAEGKISALVNTGGLTARSIIALESADAGSDTHTQVHTSLRNTKTAVGQLLKSHLSMAMESEDGETIEGNEEAGVEEDRDAMLTEAQLQAGAITAAALENPVE